MSDVKRNGPAIEKRATAMLNSEAIKSDGLTVAEHIRALGAQAKKEGEDVAQYADEIANAITEAAEEVANRMHDYMTKCQAARVSMKEHKEALVVIPPRQPTTSSKIAEAEQAVAAALDQSLRRQ